MKAKPGLGILAAALALPLVSRAEATPSMAPQTKQERIDFLQVMCDTNPRLEGCTIDVRIEDHVALLTGTARTIDQADFATSLALATQGVYGAINRIGILPVRADSELLEERVREKLDGSKALRAAAIRVQVTGAEAVLSGNVSTFDEREIARELASRVEGLRRIDNRIRIEFREPRTDAAILRQLQLDRQDDPLFELLPIQTRVDDGEVTLDGKVGSRDELDRLVRNSWVTGVVSVDFDRVTVDPDLRMVGVEDKDYHPSDTLKVVSLVLEADERVDSSGIELELANGLLTLRGRAGTIDERGLAEADARGVPGVMAVRNLLEVPSPALSSR